MQFISWCSRDGLTAGMGCHGGVPSWVLMLESDWHPSSFGLASEVDGGWAVQSFRLLPRGDFEIVTVVLHSTPET